MDALSHILEDIHLRGAEYLYVNGSGEKWAYACKGHPIFHVVLNGPVRLHVPDTGDFLLQSGDMAFIPTGVPHYVYPPSASPGEYCWLTERFSGHCNEPVLLGEGDVRNHLYRHAAAHLSHRTSHAFGGAAAVSRPKPLDGNPQKHGLASTKQEKIAIEKFRCDFKGANQREYDTTVKT